MAKVTITRSDNETGTIDESELAAAEASGFRVIGEEEATAITTRREAQSTAGMARGGLESVGRGVTFGLSDVAARGAGADMAAMQARKANLGTLGTGLELAGAAAPALLSGGTSSAATAGSMAARVGTGLAVRSPAALAARGGLALARGVGGGKVRQYAAQGAVEGFLQGAGSVASEDALGDRDLSAERMLVGGGRGAVMGGVMGGGFGAAGSGLAAVARGGKKVSRSMLDRVAGLSDDVTDPGVKAAMAKGGNFLEQAQQSQLRALGGSVDDHAALAKLTQMGRSKQGRQMVLDAQHPGSFDDLVGGKLKTAWSRGDPKAALEGYGKAFAKDARTGGVSASAETFTRFREKLSRVSRGPGEAADTIRELEKVMRKGNRKGDLFERMAKGAPDAPPNAHKYVTQTIDALEDVMAKRAGKLGTEVIGAEIGKLRSMADDPLLWGARVSSAKPLYAARQLEREAMQALPSKARKALEAGALDDASARALAKSPDAVKSVIEARSKLADVLEHAGEDVSKLRQGLDDMRGAMRYGDDLADANGAWGRLRQLEDSPRAEVARVGLEGGATLLGGALGGLGGAIGGKMAGQLLRGATRPAKVAATLAKMRQTIDAVTGREAGIVAGAERLAEGGAKAARAAAKAGRAAGRATAGTGRRGVVSAARKQEPKGRKVSARTRMLEQARSSVVKLAAKPAELPDHMGPDMEVISQVAPKLASAMAARTAMAVAFLASKAPSAYSPPFSKTVLIDPVALETFGRYVDAVRDPLAALRKLEQGGLAMEHAEALRSVYPAMYREVQDGVLKMVGKRARSGNPISELALQQMGLLLQLPLTQSQQPGFQAALAAAGQPEMAPPPPPEAPGEIRSTAKVDHGKSSQTGMQRLEAGGEHS